MKKNFVEKLTKLLGFGLKLSENNTLDISEENRNKIKTEFSEKTDSVIHVAELELQYEKELSQKDSELSEKNTNLILLQSEYDKVVSQLQIANSKIATLMDEAENKDGMLIVVKDNDNKWMGGKHTAEHIFGLGHEFYATDKWYNKLAVKKDVKKRTQAEKAELDTAFAAYSESFVNRFAVLHETGELDRLIAGNVDYSDLSTKVGDYYYVRRQDALISYILSIPTVTNLFPLHTGVQDGEVLVDAFEGRSFTQPYQSGEISGGSWKLAPHIARVKDIMFKYLFTDLKALETQYVGYLNSNGSSPIKFSFIEWIMMRCSEIIINEKNQRRVIGLRVEPNPGSSKPIFFMYGSDGVLTTKDRYTQENRTFVFEDKNVYTKSTIIDYFDSMADEVMQMIGVGTLAGMVLYFNANHIKMYLDAHHDKHHTDANYDGDKLEIKNINGLVLKGVPNMGRERYDAWITTDNNFECLENVAGEMFGFYFERRLESMWACSYGKEGTAAIRPGRAYASRAEVQNAEGRHTTIFVNKPYSLIAEDATTVDAKANRYFCTAENTGAVELTDITKAKQGILYKIECGDVASPITISKSGKFSKITAAFTSTAKGDFISVVYDSSKSEFLEYERQLNGVYTKNESLRAPEYVETI